MKEGPVTVRAIGQDSEVTALQEVVGVVAWGDDGVAGVQVKGHFHPGSGGEYGIVQIADNAFFVPPPGMEVTVSVGLQAYTIAHDESFDPADIIS